MQLKPLPSYSRRWCCSDAKRRRRRKPPRKVSVNSQLSASFALTLCSLYQFVCMCVWESIINFVVVMVLVLVT